MTGVPDCFLLNGPVSLRVDVPTAAAVLDWGGALLEGDLLGLFAPFACSFRGLF